MTVKFIRKDAMPTYIALSTDASKGKLPGAGIIGATVFFTDTGDWRIIDENLDLAHFYYPKVSTGGVISSYSPSISPSISPSLSRSVSPSLSPSLSSSLSPSLSSSVSPSLSPSTSPSASLSPSLSPSTSPSVSVSPSVSPS